jgi:uncharacterized repeat protein (TIGR03843 family)
MTTAETLQLLQLGTLDVEGILPWSSNYTFLVRIYNEHQELYAVYKPRQGERPLWDFAQGTLCQREQAAYLVSEALGWDLVPPTVVREGPHGIGSLQYFVEHDPDCHYFTLEGKTEFRCQLQQIVLLDILINNADRKAGHILLEPTTTPSQDGRLWAIDHGVCFHTSYKLRTVVWEFAGTPIPDRLLADLVRFGERLGDDSQILQAQLRELLTDIEIAALQTRLERLISRGVFREPGPGRHYPWPPV